jgi:hypothetical protein
MREIGVTDSFSQGSNTSTISLDFQTNNINHGTVTRFISVNLGITAGKQPAGPV